MTMYPELKSPSRVQLPMLAWSPTRTVVPGSSSVDVAIDIRAGEAEGVEMPRQAPTGCSTLAAAVRSGAGKLAGQTLSAGIGELAGSGVQIGLDMLDATPGAEIPSLVIKSGLVVMGAGLAGYKTGQLVQEGYGVSNGVRAVVTLAPVAIPIGLAIGAGLSGGTLVAASAVLTRTVVRMSSCVTRDVLNEVGRDVLGDTRAVDAEGRALTRTDTVDRRATVGMLAPFVPNVGVALSGQLALPQRADQASDRSPEPGDPDGEFSSGVGSASGAAAVRGGFAFMLEGGRAAAALADGGGLEYVPGKGLPAIAGNLRDIKGAVGRAYEHTSVRVALASVSGDLASGTGAGPFATGVLQALGEVRGAVVEKAHAHRDLPLDGAEGEPMPAAVVSEDGTDPLSGYTEREDSRGSLNPEPGHLVSTESAKQETGIELPPLAGMPHVMEEDDETR